MGAAHAGGGGRGNPAHQHGSRRDSAGFDIELTRSVSEAVGVPVIASGGVGTVEHFAEGILAGGASAVLAASVFHFGDLTVRQVKEHMRSRGIVVRL